MRIRLDEVHYEIVHRYEVNTGSCCLFPSGFSFDESINAYYENKHGYRLMVTRTMDGKMSFTSDFPRPTGEAYTSLEEAKDSESYKGFVALVKRMNKYRREARTAFADPAKAKKAKSLADVFEAIGEVARRRIKRKVYQKMKTTKFKPSEVGPVPVDWEVKALGEVGVFSKGLGVSRSESNSGALPCVRYGEIYTDYNDYIKEFRSFISEKVAAGAKLMSPGDILFAGSGETKEEIGKTVAFLGGVDRAYCGGDILILSPSRGYDSKFLGYVCNSQPIVAQKASRGQGDAVVHIRSGSLAEVVIPVPPRPEQEKIAEALSDVDALLAAMTKLIEKKRAIKQGAMQQLLTGKKRLAGFTGKWVEKRLGDCALIKARIGWQGLTTAEYLKNGPYYLITGSDFNDGRINWSQCYFVDKARYDQDKYIQIKKDDVLVSKDGTIGKVAFLDDVPGEGTLNSGVFVIRSTDKMIDQPYLAWVFLSRWFDDFIDRLVAGSTIVHLYQKDIVGFEFPVPPTFAEQKAIAAVLSDMDAEIASLESKRAKYESIKQGMMQELLTGKARLV